MSSAEESDSSGSSAADGGSSDESSSSAYPRRQVVARAAAGSATSSATGSGSPSLSPAFPDHSAIGNVFADAAAEGVRPTSSKDSSPRTSHAGLFINAADDEPISFVQPHSCSESIDSDNSELPLDFGEDSPASPGHPDVVDSSPFSPDRPKWKQDPSGVWQKGDDELAGREIAATAEIGTCEREEQESHQLLEVHATRAGHEAFAPQICEEGQQRLTQESTGHEAFARQSYDQCEERLSQENTDEERRQTHAQEEAFWATMSPAEAERLQGMLQAIGLYQQHLQHNEHVISDLNGQIVSGERRLRAMRRKVQQASQDADSAQEQEANFSEEVLKWNNKREKYESRGTNVLAMKAEYAAAQSECNRFREELDPLKVQLRGMQERLVDFDRKSRDQESNLTALASENKQALASLAAQHLEEMSALKAKQTEELSKLEVDLQSEVGQFRGQTAEETSRLRCLLDDVNRRMERLRQERNEAADHFITQQREGARLHQQYADAREEVLDLASQVRAYQSAPRVASQLGLSLDGSMASLSFLPLPGDDPNLDAELEEVRRHCKLLERQCARTHDALERKQAECERWRRRSMEPTARQPPASPADGGGSRSAPFILGPGEADVADGLAVS